MAKEFFKRHELKYLIPFEKYEALMTRLAPYTRRDRYGESGYYNIVSLYFESPEQKIYYETRDKLPFRQKLRLRGYNDLTSEDDVFLEIKQKHKKVVNKRRTKIKLKEAYHFIYEDLKREDLQYVDVSNQHILHEVHSFKSLYNLQPITVVSYDRQALHGVDDHDLRITFDYNLRCRSVDLHLENGPYGVHFVDPDWVILEVKVTHSVPFWLSKLLSELQCTKKSVSKFCSSIDLMNEMEEIVSQTY